MLSAKYILIAKNTLQEYFVYRVNFFFWRLQVFISFLTFYSLWSAVGRSPGFSSSLYSLSELYSYFVIGYIIRALVFTTRTQDLGGDIQNGQFSTLLLKPINIIKYYFSRDVIDKLFNLLFMIFEFYLIIILFHPNLILPSPTNFLIFILFLILSISIFFFYSLAISFSAFWIDSAWSIRFLSGVVFVNLFSGQFIPLDLLPPIIYKILVFTPFPYMYFYPVKFFIGQINLSQAIIYLITGFLCLIITAIFSMTLWLKGKQRFQSYGN
jgi:ABC-2 type transport system permease protein